MILSLSFLLCLEAADILNEDLKSNRKTVVLFEMSLSQEASQQGRPLSMKEVSTEVRSSLWAGSAHSSQAPSLT